jgi:hypothetical protein
MKWLREFFFELFFADEHLELEALRAMRRMRATPPRFVPNGLNYDEYDTPYLRDTPPWT